MQKVLINLVALIGEHAIGFGNRLSIVILIIMIIFVHLLALILLLLLNIKFS